MAPRNTFLQLPPELGGLRFGPFPGPVNLGSDAKRCQVVLDPSHGVYPVHVTIQPMNGGVYTIAPATRDGKVFLIPYGQAQVWPLTGPVQAKVGDLVVVGTPHGPRFQIQDEAPLGAAPSAAQIVQNARATGGEAGFVQGVTSAVNDVFRPAGGGIKGEVQRRATSMALASSGPFRDAYVMWTRVRTGMLNNPYWIVVLLFGILGVIGTGTVSCTGIGYVLLDLMGFGHLR
ncbi:MAG: hypothetical protein H6738_07675 [Alphaproteobacteria bacterium]|nr:hypothetical protein [Alphaproteobacteria bacterium]MCB9696644.1 hypothetical protein [Alphaproteobacteria bacterium]